MKNENHADFQEPVEYYSCFLSYSAKDPGFVERLNYDLLEAGVRCWLDSQEIRIGDSGVSRASGT
jgi:hypothetical protein